MTVLWIIERPRQLHESLTVLLQGDFAVRSFASFRNFLKIAKLSEFIPDFFIIRASDFYEEIQVMDDLLCTRFQSVPRLYFGDVEWCLGEKGKVTIVGEKSFLELPFLMQKLLGKSSERTSATLIQLADLVFDSVDLRLRLLPHGEWIRLTPKEGQILRYFMKNPNLCLSHEDLVLAIWKDVKVSTRSMASHVSRLRRYLRESQLEIRNVYGGGYQLCNSTFEASD